MFIKLFQFVGDPGMFFPSSNALTQASQVCCNTPRFLRNAIRMFLFRFCPVCGGGREGPDVIEILRGSSEEKMPTSDDVSRMTTVLIAISGVEIDNTSEGTGDWGRSLSLCCSTRDGTTAIVARILKDSNRSS